MDQPHRLTVLGILLAASRVSSSADLPAALAAGTPQFLPQDMGAVNVKDYGAKGDGKTDDTQALQRALNQKNRFVYLPAGTYLVSDTLEWGKPQKRRFLQGAGRNQTVIRLQDRASGFENPDQPQPVVTTFEGKSTGQAFRNAIYDLTVDVGSGNPGSGKQALFTPTLRSGFLSTAFQALADWWGSFLRTVSASG